MTAQVSASVNSQPNVPSWFSEMLPLSFDLALEIQKFRGLVEDKMNFGRSKKEIEFDALDNKPVKLFFLLLLHDDVQHLFSISYISKLLMNEDILEQLENAENAEDVELALTKNVLN